MIAFYSAKSACLGLEAKLAEQRKNAPNVQHLGDLKVNSGSIINALAVDQPGAFYTRLLKAQLIL